MTSSLNVALLFWTSFLSASAQGRETQQPFPPELQGHIPVRLGCSQYRTKTSVRSLSLLAGPQRLVAMTEGECITWALRPPRMHLARRLSFEPTIGACDKRGSRIAVGDAFGITLLNGSTMQPEASISAGNDSFCHVCFSGDGKELYVLSSNGRVRALDLLTMKSALIYDAAAETTFVCIDEQNKYLAIGTQQGNVTLMDLPLRKRVKELRGLNGPVRFIALLEHPCVVLAACTADDEFPNCRGQIVAWGRADGKSVWHQDAERSSYMSIALSASRKEVAVGRSDGWVDIYHADGFRLVRQFKVFAKRIRALAYSNELLAVSADNAVELWQPNGQRVEASDGHKGSVIAMAFRPNDRLVSVGMDRSVRLWDLETRGQVSITRLDEEFSKCPSITAAHIAAQYLPRRGVQLLDAQHLGVSRIVQLPVPYPELFALAPNEGTVSFMASDGSISVYDLKSERIATRIGWEPGMGKLFSELAYTGDSEYLFTLYLEPAFCVWSLKQRKRLRIPGVDGSDVFYAAPSVKGNAIAVARRNGSVCILDCAKERMRNQVFMGDSRVSSIALSADEKMVAAGAADGTVTVWEVASARVRTRLKAGDGRVMAIVFDQNGSRIAAANADTTISVFTLRDKVQPHDVGQRDNE